MYVYMYMYITISTAVYLKRQGMVLVSEIPIRKLISPPFQGAWALALAYLRSEGESAPESTLLAPQLRPRLPKVEVCKESCA